MAFATAFLLNFYISVLTIAVFWIGFNVASLQDIAATYSSVLQGLQGGLDLAVNGRLIYRCFC